MKDATREGVTQACKKDKRSEITEDEESIFWEKGLLGSQSAEILLNTIYFYNGKLFGLRAGEHRLLRLANIVVNDNVIVFDESCSKTFKGGLKDLNCKPRYIEHVCHDKAQLHSPCLASMYSCYIEKIQKHAQCTESFYFRPHRSGNFQYEQSPIGSCTLNKILPEKLCSKAGLTRKTAHCLRVTCATRMFQNSVNEKLTRERTGHKSNALFDYQKPSKQQIKDVSNILGPASATKTLNTAETIVKSFAGCENITEKVPLPMGESAVEDVDFPQFDVSDEVLASMPLPDSSGSNNGENKVFLNSVLNNCNINIVFRK